MARQYSLEERLSRQEVKSVYGAEIPDEIPDLLAPTDPKMPPPEQGHRVEAETNTLKLAYRTSRDSLTLLKRSGGEYKFFQMEPFNPGEIQPSNKSAEKALREAHADGNIQGIDYQINKFAMEAEGESPKEPAAIKADRLLENAENKGCGDILTLLSTESASLNE